MTIPDMRSPTAADLVKQFETIALSQAKASDEGHYKLCGRLLEELQGVQSEIELIPGEGLASLLPLLKSPSEWVRLYAGRALIPLAYKAAREVLEQLADDPISPCCVNAAMTLDRLDGRPWTK